MDTQNSFAVTVTDISALEFTSALRRLQSRPSSGFFALIVLVFAFGLLLWGWDSLSTYVVTLVVFVVLLLYLEIKRWQDYGKFPKTIELNYEFDPNGWRLRVKSESSFCAWASTVKLVETKRLFLLYNSKNASNLLPKRCLSEEQITLIRTWYKDRVRTADSE